MTHARDLTLADLQRAIDTLNGIGKNRRNC